MKRRMGFFVLGVVVAMMGVGVRHRLGIKPIESAVSEYDEIGVKIRVREAGSQGEYIPLTGESVVSGVIDIIGEIPVDGEEFIYMEYKMNGFNYAVGYGTSYSAQIDTHELPDGWNQLLAIGYKEDVGIEGVEQVIFRVENNKVPGTKASRQEGYY